jgi:adenylate cyclase
VPIDVGIALHHGEAAYGNVGSGERLDFTIIGRDVNLASRIAQLNKVLGEPLLMSQSFVEFLWGDPEPLGSHDVNGFDEAVAVYRPRSEDAALRRAG